MSADAATNRGGQEAPETPATELHGLPGSNANPGFGGNSANPNNAGAKGGGGMHNIAGGAPGQNGAPASEAGEPPACTLHGGMGDNDGEYDNPSCLPDES